MDGGGLLCLALALIGVACNMEEEEGVSGGVGFRGWPEIAVSGAGVMGSGELVMGMVGEVWRERVGAVTRGYAEFCGGGGCSVCRARHMAWSRAGAEKLGMVLLWKCS